MRLKNIINTASVIIILTVLNISAAIEPIEELSFSIPGLSGEITQIAFNDIDNDNIPEILATDGSILVLYSIATDSILFSDTIPLSTNYVTNYSILFDDVNRDSLPDILFARELRTVYPVPAANGYDIFLYDNNNGYNLNYFEPLYSDTFEEYFDLGYGYDNLISLQAEDFDNDGYNELLFSIETNAFYDFFPTSVTMETNGTSFMYYSFPDSILWESDIYYSNLTKSSDANSFIVNSHYSMSGDIHFIGQTKRIHEYPRVINSFGTHVDFIIDPFYSVLNCNDDRIYTNEFNRSKFICSGLLLENNSNQCVLSSVNWSHGVTCYDNTNYTDFTATGSELVLQQFIAPDSLEEIWTIDISGLSYTNFLFHPLEPGYYFAFDGNTLQQFNGADGSIYQTNDTLPTGRREWVYPFDDALPRLAITDSNYITLYKFDISTGIDDIQNRTNLPASFTLSQNYPNPFNPSTMIEYSLPRKGDVVIDIYNILGQKIVTLVNAEKSAGIHQINWDASGQSSGIYLIKLSYGDESKSIKTMLLK